MNVWRWCHWSFPWYVYTFMCVFRFVCISIQRNRLIRAFDFIQNCIKQTKSHRNCTTTTEILSYFSIIDINKIWLNFPQHHTLGWDLKDNLVPATLPLVGTPSLGPSSSKSHPTWPPATNFFHHISRVCVLANSQASLWTLN